LGTETIRVTAVAVSVPGTTLSSFNAAFRDQFNVVRLGLNYAGEAVARSTDNVLRVGLNYQFH
jgi:hypothetical protein